MNKELIIKNIPRFMSYINLNKHSFDYKDYDWDNIKEWECHGSECFTTYARYLQYDDNKPFLLAPVDSNRVWFEIPHVSNIQNSPFGIFLVVEQNKNYRSAAVFTINIQPVRNKNSSVKYDLTYDFWGCFVNNTSKDFDIDKGVDIDNKSIQTVGKYSKFGNDIIGFGWDLRAHERYKKTRNHFDPHLHRLKRAYGITDLWIFIKENFKLK